MKPNRYMLTKLEKKELRADLFRHLDGVVTAPVMAALAQGGVLAYLLKHQSCEIGELSKEFSANEGYLNVALRVLCSQGWLEQQVDNEKNEVRYKLNQHSAIAFELAWIYDDVFDLLKFSERFHPRKFEKEPFEVLVKIFKKYRDSFNLPKSDDPAEQLIQQQMLRHVEGILVGPTVVHLGMSGMFHKYFMEASFRPEEFHADADSFTQLLKMFAHFGWFEEYEGTFRFTEKGLFYAKRASAYGVTVSYIPTFRKMEELLFGNPLVLQTSGPDETELHVDRTMNVWGSGGAHAAYFKVIDEAVIELFNRPIQEQPMGIMDMGCGNGAFIQHLFDVIESQTLRGKMLDEHPLFLVGADYNEAALKITRGHLIQADIWAKVIWGDIGDPERLATDLKELYGIHLNDLLNVRTFLDHNRPWNAPQSLTNRLSTSGGAFASKGKRLSNNAVEDSLLEHLQKWKPYVQRFGLLVIELHTIAPDIAARHIGESAATAYDATHGFSDQYIVELDVFRKVAEEAGLHSDKRFFRKFPDSEAATISINLLKGQV